MKNSIKKISALILLGATSVMYGQVNLTTNPDISSIPNGTPFLDASSYYDPEISGSNNIGKGLVFPQVNLREFEFNITQPGGVVLPTWYDGMVVYNTGKGKTGGNPTKQGQEVDVEPGFYFFYNPDGKTNNSVSQGRWVRIGEAFSSTPTYVAKGTFVHNGGNSVVLSNMPDANALKSIKSISIRRTDNNGKLEGGVVITSFYSYDETTKTAVFGQGAISLPMPAGNYEYVIEYTK